MSDISMERMRQILASAAVTGSRPPTMSEFGFEFEEPADLRAFYAATDGIDLADGTRILPRGELVGATSWLIDQKALDWPETLFVLGERGDMVILRDVDADNERAGGGILEAPHDGLSSFTRVGLSLPGWLTARAKLGPDPTPSPEATLGSATMNDDLRTLSAALERPHYPGSQHSVAHGALIIGLLRAKGGDLSGAMEALDWHARVRVSAVSRNVVGREALAAWRAAELESERAGLGELAAMCAGRAAQS